MFGPEDDDVDVCPTCDRDGGHSATMYDDGEESGDLWVPCIDCDGN